MKKYILIIFIAFLYFSCKYDEIKKNKGMTLGKISYSLSHAKGGYSIKYVYKIGNESFEGMIGTFYKCNFEKTFQGKYFPVVYSTINPEKSILLITPNDFNSWGYEFPDSLNWVKDCL